MELKKAGLDCLQGLKLKILKLKCPDRLATTRENPDHVRI